MKLLEFKNVAKRLFEPSFPGVEIVETIKLTKAPKSKKSTVYLTPTKLRVHVGTSFEFKLVRQQPFSSSEKNFLEKLVAKLNSLIVLGDANLFEMASLGIGRVVAAEILGNNNSQMETISRIAETLEGWSSETYEGNGISVSFLVTDTPSPDTPSPGKPKVVLTDFFKEDFSKVLSNGFDTIIEFNADGRFEGYRPVDSFDQVNWRCPFRYSGLASLTAGNKNVCLSLNRQGEILAFAGGELKVAKRRGSWLLFDHDTLLAKLAFGAGKKILSALRKEIYGTVLDVSFARCGGCIGYIYKEKLKALSEPTPGPVPKLPTVNSADFLKRYSEKARSKALSMFANTPIKEIDRRIRQEMVGIDGASIIDANGKIISIGAIINYDAGSTGGGRTAAAMKLSQFGIGIKISADGKITVYHNGEKGFEFA